MGICKHCVYFQPCSKITRLNPFHVRGFCMDFDNETFNPFAKALGGLNWKAYFHGTDGCKFKR